MKSTLRSNLLLGYFLGALTASAATYASMDYLIKRHEIDSLGKHLEKRLSYSRQGTPHFTAPLLECGRPIAEVQNSVFVGTFVSQIEEIESATGSDISVYMKNYEDGRSYGYKEEKSFRPGSLIKVALLISYFKRAESDPEILNERIKWDDKSLASLYDVQFTAPSSKLEFGKTYKISELIEAAIIKSDNVAAALLERGHHSELRELANDLNVPLNPSIFNGKEINIRRYSSLFRVLFNASYLNEADSEKALELMNKVEFKDGFVAGVPAGVKVSHKFGESAQDGINYMNECGVFYPKTSPYLLCVTVRNPKLKNLASVLKSVSSKVYSLNTN
jgi:hypothetical protein